MFSYLAYGLYIKSEIPLPELVSVPGNGEVYIHLDHQGNIPSAVAGNHDLFINIDLEESILYDRDAALFVIRHGREIIVTPVTDDERLISLYLIGTIMSILLYQRGLFILHGSAIAFHDSAVVFVGKSGWGKSTMAAALHAKGHRIITDDVVAAKIEGDVVTLFPGYPQLKLFPKVAEVLGHNKSDLLFLHPELNKGGFRVAEEFSQTALPIKQIYMLAQGDSIGIEPLSPRSAFVELMRHSLPTRWYQTHNAAQFQQCTSIVKHIPIYQLQRTDDLRSLPTLADMVEQHLADELQPSLV
jgi:hypothetical protein